MLDLIQASVRKTTVKEYLSGIGGEFENLVVISNGFFIFFDLKIGLCSLTVSFRV